MIDKNDILARLKTKDALEFYGVHFNSKNFANCPFHTEKTPSFHYNPKTDKYKCFSCGEGGTVIDFVMKSYNLNFPEALKKINTDFNLGLDKELSPEEQQKQAETMKITKLLNQAERNWNQSLNIVFMAWVDIYRNLQSVNPRNDELIDKIETILDENAVRLAYELYDLLSTDEQNYLNEYAPVKYLDVARGNKQPKFSTEDYGPEKAAAGKSKEKSMDK